MDINNFFETLDQSIGAGYDPVLYVYSLSPYDILGKGHSYETKVMNILVNDPSNKSGNLI